MSDDFKGAPEHTITGDDWARSLRAARKRRAGAQARLSAVLKSSHARDEVPSWEELRSELTGHDVAAEAALHEIVAALLQGCPTWEEAVKRAFAWAMATRAELLGSITCGEVASLFGQTRAAISDRVDREYSQPLERAGFRCTRTPWQRNEETREDNAARMIGKRHAAKTAVKPEVAA